MVLKKEHSSQHSQDRKYLCLVFREANIRSRTGSNRLCSESWQSKKLVIQDSVSTIEDELLVKINSFDNKQGKEAFLLEATT